MEQPVTGVPVGGGANYHEYPLMSMADYQGCPPVTPNCHPTLGTLTQGQWSTGLFDCTSDVPNCRVTCWCPWITFGRNAEIIDRGSSSCGVSGGLYALIAVLTRCQWIYSWGYRTKLKQQYGIMPMSNCQDACIHLWCHPCALFQEYRELQHHGFDPNLGWYGNMEKWNQAMAIGVTNPPEAPGAMIMTRH